MHARVPIAPEMTRPSPTPPSPPGDPHDTARRSPQRLNSSWKLVLTLMKFNLKIIWPAE